MMPFPPRPFTVNRQPATRNPQPATLTKTMSVARFKPSPYESHESSRQTSSGKRRSAFRQRLVDAERGVTLGFRRDSTFFVHFFTASTIVAAGMVIGLSAVQWAILLLSFTLVLAAEMFQRVFKTILESLQRQNEVRATDGGNRTSPSERWGDAAPPEAHNVLPSFAAERAERLGTAAVVLTIAGTALAVGLVFYQRLSDMFGG